MEGSQQLKSKWFYSWTPSSLKSYYSDVRLKAVAAETLAMMNLVRIDAWTTISGLLGDSNQLIQELAEKDDKLNVLVHTLGKAESQIVELVQENDSMRMRIDDINRAWQKRLEAMESDLLSMEADLIDSVHRKRLFSTEITSEAELQRTSSLEQCTPRPKLHCRAVSVGLSYSPRDIRKEELKEVIRECMREGFQSSLPTLLALQQISDFDITSPCEPGATTPLVGEEAPQTTIHHHEHAHHHVHVHHYKTSETDDYDDISQGEGVATPVTVGCMRAYDDNATQMTIKSRNRRYSSPGTTLAQSIPNTMPDEPYIVL